MAPGSRAGWRDDATSSIGKGKGLRMPETRSFMVGDQVMITDISQAPEGSWLVRETMQFLRSEDGRSITSLTSVQGEQLPVQKMPERFTLVYAGHPTIAKSVALKAVFNAL